MSRLRPLTFAGSVNAAAALLIVAVTNELVTDVPSRQAAGWACLGQFMLVQLALIIASWTSQEPEG